MTLDVTIRQPLTYDKLIYLLNHCVFNLPSVTSNSHLVSPICSEFIEIEYNGLDSTEHQCHHNMYLLISDEAPAFGGFIVMACFDVIKQNTAN